jgi:chromosome partitioning protein
MKVITLIGKGGGGKSTTAINLATVAAHHHMMVGVIDADPQGSLCHWRAMRGRADIKVVPANNQTRLSEVLDSACKARLDLLLIDTSPELGSHTLAAARASNMVLILARPAAFDLSVTQRRVEALRSVGVQFGIVLNATPPRRDAREAPHMRDAREALRGLCDRLWRGQITRRHIIIEAANAGKGVIECEPAGPAAIEYGFLWADVERNIGIRKRQVAA